MANGLGSIGLLEDGAFVLGHKAAAHGPGGDMAEFQPITASLGTLMGICPECEGTIYRRVGLAKLPQIQGKLEVTFTKAQRRISETSFPIVNSDFNQG